MMLLKSKSQQRCKETVGLRQVIDLKWLGRCDYVGPLRGFLPIRETSCGVRGLRSTPQDEGLSSLRCTGRMRKRAPRRVAFAASTSRFSSLGALCGLVLLERRRPLCCLKGAKGSPPWRAVPANLRGLVAPRAPGKYRQRLAQSSGVSSSRQLSASFGDRRSRRQIYMHAVYIYMHLSSK